MYALHALFILCGVYLRLSERAKSEKGLIKWSSSAVRVKHLRNIQRHFSSLTNSPEANKNGVSRNSRPTGNVINSSAFYPNEHMHMWESEFVYSGGG